MVNACNCASHLIKTLFKITGKEHNNKKFKIQRERKRKVIILYSCAVAATVDSLYSNKFCMNTIPGFYITFERIVADSNRDGCCS